MRKVQLLERLSSWGLDERVLQSRLVVTLVCWEVVRVGREVLVYGLKGRLQCRRNYRSQVM